MFFQTAPSGTTGTTFHTPVTRMKIDSVGNLTLSGNAIISGSGSFGTSLDIGTNISINGQSDRTLSVNSNTTSNTKGMSFTIQSGNSSSDAIDKAGGDLIISGGASHGTGTSNVLIQTATAQGSGTGVNPPTSKVQVYGNGDVELLTTSAGIIMKSPDGTRYKVTVSNGGTLTVTAQ